MSAYEVRRFDELDSIAVAGVHWRPIRRALGIRAFGINAYTGDTGEHVVEEHTEERLGHEEVYTVVTGRARFTLGGDEVDVSAGAFVYVRDPSTKRAAVALEDGTTILAVGGKPDEAHEPSGWEWGFAAYPHRERGDYRRGLEIVREGLAEQPENPELHFYVACYESLVGNRDEALARLRVAVEGDGRVRDWARGHVAFETLRDDPEFLAIAGKPEPAGGGS